MEAIAGESKEGKVKLLLIHLVRLSRVSKCTPTFFLPWTFTCLLSYRLAWWVISWFLLMCIFTLIGLFIYSLPFLQSSQGFCGFFPQLS